ncbi:undecaprenyl-phosphate glucose phosphotransferase [soil metagenome]
MPEQTWEIGGNMGVVSSGRYGHFIDGEVVQRLVKLADFCVLGSGALALAMLASHEHDGGRSAIFAGFAALLVTFFLLLLLRTLGLYGVQAMVRGPKQLAMSFIACGAGSLVAFAIADFFFAPSGSLLSWWAIIVGIHLTITRLGISLWIGPRAQAGRFRRRVAIVGGGKAAEDAISVLEGSRNAELEIAGLFDDRFDDRSPASIRKHRKLGSITELAAFAREQRIDLIIVAIPLAAEGRLLQILKRLWELPVDIRISGQSSRLKLSPRAYSHIGNLPLLAVFDRPLTAWGSLLKKVMDQVLAALLLVALSPLMLATALAVRWESKGPVLFKQKRYGFNNELIEIYKFRSMYAERSDRDAVKLVTKGDPRVTRVGRIIRKTSIDELPQLFNVLTGQLSLVGPRPHATQAKAAEALYEQVVDGYFARHKVKPGITGWAQINGWRGETDTHEKLEQRVKYDLDYIDRWSLLFDLYIILKTPVALLRTQNAY